MTGLIPLPGVELLILERADIRGSYHALTPIEIYLGHVYQAPTSRKCPPVGIETLSSSFILQHGGAGS
jgi:hypothetical protein